MTLAVPLAPPEQRSPDLTTHRPPRRPEGPRPRLLAVVTDRETALSVLDRVYPLARDAGHDVHTAVFLPRQSSPLDELFLTTRDEEDVDQATALTALAAQRAAAHGVQARISVHRLAGLDGHRRQRVLSRATRRLARRLDAVPVGGMPA